MVFIINVDALGLKSILLSHVLALLTVHFLLRFLLFHELPLLSSLALKPLLLLHGPDISLWVLLFLVETLSCRLEGPAAELVLRGRLKGLIINHLGLLLGIGGPTFRLAIFGTLLGVGVLYNYVHIIKVLKRLALFVIYI